MKDLSEQFIGKTLTKEEVENNLKILSNPDTELEKKVRLEGFIQGIGELGAQYVSHGNHNIYFKLTDGHQLDSDVRIKRAKNTCFMLTGLILRFTE